MKKLLNKKILTKTAAAAMAATLAFVPMATAVMAANSTDPTNNTATANDLTNSDIIDYAKKGSLEIYKYDITAAEAAGDYEEGTIVANGEVNTELQDTMSDYAIEGVQFSYLRVGNIETWSNTTAEGSDIVVVYEIPSALADILELDSADAYDMTADSVASPCHNAGVGHYDSTQISDALKAILDADDIAAKDALESYLYDYGTLDSTTDQDTKTSADTGVKAVNMPKTDANGHTKVENLEIGLYLIIETEVPEQVTDTVDPWFASIPFTNMSLSKDADNDGDGGEQWLYDMVCYPKNQTGNPTLDKSVRNAYSNTAAIDDKNGTVNSGDQYVAKNDSGALVVYNDDTNAENTADTSDDAYVANRGGYTADGITAGADGAGYSEDFAYRDTTTASANDVLDYIIVSKLPHITSKATFLSEYTFTDILSKGMTYNRDVKIAFYDNADDANANNTENAILKWNVTSSEFDQQYVEVSTTDEATGAVSKDGSNQLTVKLTEAGLKVINETGIDSDDAARVGMSDYYMVVYYTATVDSGSDLVLGDEGNRNDVVLQWSRTSDSYYNVLEDRNYVYAYSLDLTKTFSDNKGEFDEVEFKLYNATDAYYVEAQYSEADDVYYVTGKNVSEDAATTFIPHDKDGDNKGTIVVYGLEADKYQLTEIATDNGYTLLADQLVVEIEETQREVIASVAGVTGMDQDAVDAIVEFYNGGIYNENGQLVDAGADELTGADSTRPAIQDANGRTIGKTDMFVGAINPATATVDRVAATMQAQDSSDNATVILSVVNNANFKLPQTGGLGTLLFTLAGCAAAFAGVLVMTKKKKEA